MKKIFALCKRDFISYFSLPIAYIVIAIFLFIAGNVFWVAYYNFGETYKMYSQYSWAKQDLSLAQMVFRPFFMVMSNILLFTIPLITMRLISEEKKLGTFEFLFTSPITVPQIIFGKFFAAALFVLIMLLTTSVYPLLLAIYGKPDLSMISCGYLGLFLLALAFIALGLFASSLTENQIISAIIGFAIILLFWIINWGADRVRNPKLADILNYLSIPDHFMDFAKGVIDTQHLFYFLSLVALGLFLTGIILQSQRWR
jgi:ABC-2 type transport system permease protein